MGRVTVQLETVVSTISQEYLLEFTLEYGISKALHPELPGSEDRIIDFPEGKARPRVDVFQQEAWEKYPAVLHQALRLSKKLKQPLFLGGREGVPNYHGLVHECSKRWDAGQEYVFPRVCKNTGHTPYPNPKTTRGTTLLNGVKPQILPGRRDMDLFNLIRAPNPTKVKTSSRPRAAHEVPLLTVTANRVIEIEDPAAATDSSGVPSTIERSSLDFSNENPSQQSTGPEDQETAAPEVPPPEDVSTMRGAPEAQRKGLLPQIPLRSKNAAREAMMRLIQTRPLRSSKGAAAVGDPESENTSFASMVAIGSQLQLRFEQEAKLLKKSVVQVARWDKKIQARENKIKNLETQLEAEADMKKAAEDKSVDSTRAEIDARLDALSIDFDEELYPRMLTAIAGRRWMIGRGLRLAMMKCGESIELRQAFTDVVSAGIAKGMSEGLKHEVEHGHANLNLEAIEAYDLEAKAKYIAALQALKNLKYPLVDQLEGLKDAPIDVIMASLHLESDTGDDAPQWACKEEILLADAIAANVSRAEKKKKCRVVCRTHGVGSAHHTRSDGILVSVPTVVPQGLAILLADATTQTETSDEASPQLLRSSSLLVIHS
nr:transposase (putative), gypsy type [Tanacetum cinerariifolium]